MIRKVLGYWPLVFLLLATFVLRIYKIDELFYFTYDESVPAFVARKLIIFKDISLLGGVTPFGFHLGPYFYWFLALILFFGKLDPIAWGWASAGVAMVTTFMFFLVGKLMVDKKTGFIAASIWTFSFLANVYDRHLWALYWGPLVCLVVIFSLYKIIKKKENYIYLLAFILAFAIHADLSNLVFLFVSFLVLRAYRIFSIKKMAIVAGIIILSFTPLVIFDLRHQFSNTRPVLGFFNQYGKRSTITGAKIKENLQIFPYALTRLIYSYSDNEVSKQYSYCSQYVKEKYNSIPKYAVFMSSIFLAGFLLFSFRRKSNDTFISLISITVITYILGIQMYGSIFGADIFEHYISGVFPAMILAIAYIFSKLPKPLWVVALSIYIYINLSKLSAAQDLIGFVNKRQAINFTMSEISNIPFSLDSLSTCWKYSGYRYLFAVFGREPVKSYVDPNLAYLYGTTKVGTEHPKTVVSFVVHDFVPETADFYQRYAILKSHGIKSQLFGNIEVIILDNSTNWFK